MKNGWEVDESERGETSAKVHMNEDVVIAGGDLGRYGQLLQIEFGSRKLAQYIVMKCMVRDKEFSRSVMSDSLRPHELQHTRLPCPSPTPRAYPNSCPLSR